MEQNTVERRRAVEALRAGVPNRDVVRMLPPMQENIEERFQTLLDATENGWATGRQAPGILLEGDFGTGKSHWLEYFQHVALEQNYVCSTVVLNKETPLYDPVKVYRGCVESAVAPGKESGPALEEIALTYSPERAPYHQELVAWAHSDPELDPRLVATLYLFERNADPEMRRRILNEWTGYPMAVPLLRLALKEIGAPPEMKVGRPLKMPVGRRFEFLSRLFRSAGYAGWVVLFDEAEMVSKYSLRQRAKAYAHLGELLGLYKGAGTPGLASVFTITKDYTGQVLLGRKNDLESIPARLPGTRDEEVIAPAEAGMKAIKGKGTELRPPSREQVDAVYRKVRELYSGAYQWPAPELENRIEYSSSTGMRQYIRSWVNAWDLRRLYDYEASLVTEEVSISYEEDTDLQAEPPAGEDEGVSG